MLAVCIRALVGESSLKVETIVQLCKQLQRNNKCPVTLSAISIDHACSRASDNTMGKDFIQIIPGLGVSITTHHFAVHQAI
jgi:hypothetical protein